MEDDFRIQIMLYLFPVVIFFILVSSRSNMSVKLPVKYRLKVVNQNSAINPARMSQNGTFQCSSGPRPSDPQANHCCTYSSCFFPFCLQVSYRSTTAMQPLCADTFCFQYFIYLYFNIVFIVYHLGALNCVERWWHTNVLNK